MKNRKNSFYARYIKRLLDIILSFAGMLVLSPIYLLLAILVKVKLGSPVIFCQERPGKNEKIFKLYKFRSMTDARDANGRLLPDNERLTRFGKILRSTSLDELPELFNILKGEMSIVGPRPILTFQMEECNVYQKQRLIVRPGLTCYWQIGGRADIQWEEWVELDLKYIKDMGIGTDLVIILKTIPVVLRGDGAY